MKKFILIILSVLVFGSAYAAIAEQTNRICNDLNYTQTLHFIPITKEFRSEKDARQILLESLPFKEFSADNPPIPDFFEIKCSQYSYGYTCSWPELGISITSGSNIRVDCSFQGPTVEGAISSSERRDELRNLRIANTVIITLIIMCLCAIAYLIWKKNRPEPEQLDPKQIQKIKTWVDYNLAKGYTKEQLKQTLKEQGYKKSVLKKI